MAFDLAFNFRGTAGYVTDPSYAVPVLGEAYPHTYTNGDGYSLNAGWSSGSVTAQNRVDTNDPRIAGRNYEDPGPEAVFTIDLSSGSAPGAGEYTVDVALGWVNATTLNTAAYVKDNGTTLITCEEVAFAAPNFIDATEATVSATTTWTGTPATKTFASTTAQAVISNAALAASSYYGVVSHFRLTKAASAYTLALAHAQLTLTGQAVATRTARLLAVQHASLAMTGQVAALRAERQLALDAAALTLTGQAAALQHGYEMALAHAQLTVTGQATTLQRTAQLLLDRGLLALRGQAVTLRKSGVGAGQMMRRHHHDRG